MYLGALLEVYGSLGSLFGDLDGVLGRYRGALGSFLGRVGKARELLPESVADHGREFVNLSRWK